MRPKRTIHLQLRWQVNIQGFRAHGHFELASISGLGGLIVKPLGLVIVISVNSFGVSFVFSSGKLPMYVKCGITFRQILTIPRTRWKTDLMDLRRSCQHCYNHVWTKLHKSGPVRMSLDQSGQVWTILNQSGQVWTSLDESGRDWTSLDESGRAWKSLDKSGQV